MNHREIINQRVKRKEVLFMDAATNLYHFAMINYAVPKESLEKYIPTDRFEIPEFDIQGKKLAMISAVTFLDTDFRFLKIFPSFRFSFGQTNYRVYVIDKLTGEYLVWFFGTTMGSKLVRIPRILWKIPWHYANYSIDCQFSNKKRRYVHYHIETKSDWAASTVILEDTGVTVRKCEGFENYDTLKLILTQPVTGFFYTLNKKVGTYSIWHNEMELTHAIPRNIYFSLFEKLELLTREEMQNPHSIFICPKVFFKIHLPPKQVIL
jgi:hypothetical protein